MCSYKLHPRHRRCLPAVPTPPRSIMPQSIRRRSEPERVAAGAAYGATLRSLSGSGGRSNSQLPQPVACLQGFVGMRIALDQVAQFTDSIVLLAELNQGKSLLQLRRRSFATAGKVL